MDKQKHDQEMLYAKISTVFLTLLALLAVFNRYFAYRVVCPGSLVPENKALRDANAKYKFEKDFTIYKSENFDQDRENKKLLIIFYGNDSCDEFHVWMLDEITKQKNFPFDEIAIINYDKKTSSIDSSVNRYADKIEKFIRDNNYERKNICLLGYSLGGGLVTKTLEELGKTNSEKFKHLIIYNSFSALHRVLPWFKMENKFIRKAASALLSAVCYGYDINSQSSLISKNFPVEKTTVINTKGDLLIDEYAEMYSGVKKSLEKNPGLCSRIELVKIEDAEICKKYPINGTHRTILFDRISEIFNEAFEQNSMAYQTT